MAIKSMQNFAWGGGGVITTSKVPKKNKGLLVQNPLLKTQRAMDVFHHNSQVVDNLSPSILKKIEIAIVKRLNPVQLKSDSRTTGLKNLVCDTTEVGKTCRRIFNQIVKNSR